MRKADVERSGRFPTAAAEASAYQRAWRARRILREWQAADGMLRRSRGPARNAYERAIAAALPHLERFDSMDALVHHATTERHRRAEDPGSPPPEGTVERWLEAACRSVPGGDALEQQIVAGAAFWRRAQTLMAAPGD